MSRGRCSPGWSSIQSRMRDPSPSTFHCLARGTGRVLPVHGGESDNEGGGVAPGVGEALNLETPETTPLV